VLLGARADKEQICLKTVSFDPPAGQTNLMKIWSEPHARRTNRRRIICHPARR